MLQSQKQQRLNKTKQNKTKTNKETKNKQNKAERKKEKQTTLHNSSYFLTAHNWQK